MTTDPSQRLGVLGIIGISLLLTLLVRLWFLQVVTAEDLSESATANRIRVVHEQAPRGRVFDTNRNVLVDNREIIQVTVDPRALDDAEVADDGFDRGELFQRLSTDLARFGTAVSVEEIEAAIDDPARDPLKPVVIASDVSELLEVYLLERHREMPGVDVDRTAVRSYPYGSVAAHVLGYVGEINEEELTSVEGSEKEYRAGDEIGKTGIEAAYEDVLRGVPGQRVYELDAEGNIVRLVEEESQAPVPGLDLQLALDVDLQAYAEEQLAIAVEGADAPKGALVVQDPQDGSVLAMASYPPYNPAEFVQGLSATRYAELTRPESGYPLNNWAIQGAYPPASTFKLITGWAGTDAELRAPGDTISDPGFYVAQGCSEEDPSCRFNNDNEVPYYAVNLSRALTVSSDVYFYGLGDLFWLRRDDLGEDGMQQRIEEWGFGQQLGVDLPSEIGGLVSTPELKAERHELYPEAFPFGQWFTGDNINMSIGQGDMLVTPLQLNNAYASFANGGTVRTPLVGAQVTRDLDDGDRDTEDPFEIVEEIEPEVLNEVEVPEDVFNAMQEGLLGVTRSADGTAAEAFEGFPGDFPVAGKTGTAQVAAQDYGNALFASYGPVNGFPVRYAVTAVIENTPLYGGELAAPLVRAIYDAIADPSLMPKAPTADAVFGADGQDPDELAGDELAAAPGAS